MVIGLPNGLFGFQEKAVKYLLETTAKSDSNEIVTMKSPTGSGKTIILLDYIDEYLSRVNSNTAFIWLCPGKGDLEEQSRLKMKKHLPSRDNQNLFDALLNGFEEETTTFINWELVTKRGNRSIQESERKNLFDRIAEAHRNGVNFIIIIDEEHSHNTSRARAIIDSFSARHIIRVSATTIKNELHEFYEIDEVDVIGAGLITKAIYVNEGIEDNIEITNDYDCLLDLANEKRKAIANRYAELGKQIRPLVLIQFPNAQPETIVDVENKLENMGYTYENGMVSKWMSGDKKDIPDNLTDNDGIPVFLLMKQAISTGWDCPRAKILVKLREGMNEDFEIQTIGRIRRMPEAIQYEDELLDFCYVYTFDEKYKAGLLADIDKAYERRRLFLKDKCKTFRLEKETRDLDFDGLGEREVLNRLHDFFIEKYKLTGNKEQNKGLLADKKYVFGNEIFGKALYGEFVRSSAIMESENFYTTRKKVNTHTHGIELLHSVDAIKSAIGMQTGKVKTVLERLFRKGGTNYKRLLTLDTSEFYAFVINNEHRLKEEFREVTSTMYQQQSILLHPRKSNFRIPEQDFYKYDPLVKSEVEYLSNAYHDYSSGYTTSRVSWNSQQLFEQYCESHDDIDWVYKNGDSGQQYFSVVYVDGVQVQWLFYPDYIIKKKDGTVWIIETKGGESKGQDRNIDIQIGNKFNAFKRYAEEKNLNWGFVRDLDNQLYINNTEFVQDMSNEHWVDLNEVF